MENEFLLEHIGKTFTQKLQDEIGSNYFELQKKAFPKQTFPIRALSLVTIQKDKEILKIGHSCVNDLIIKAFIQWFAVWFSNDPAFKSFQDANTTSDNYFIYHTGSNPTQFTNFFGGAKSVGTSISLGADSTTPTRNDNKLTDFKQSMNTGDGGYQSGLGRVQVSGIVNIIGTYDLSETSINGNWLATSGGQAVHVLLLTHDIISPVIPVTVVDQANVTYLWQLS